MTDKYAVIGNPIAHSKSPEIHTMFAEQFKGKPAGDMVYKDRILAPLDGFAATVERLRKESYKGCNVTVPFKFEALQLSTRLIGRAQVARAVNTLKFEGNAILGDNTDGFGLVRDITKNLGFDIVGKHVLLMGAGGAAHGVAQPLFDINANLAVVNRTVEKAQRMTAAFDKQHQATVHTYEELVGQRFDVVINATSSGLADEMPALPPGIFAPGALAYEMMYGRETPFMKFASANGAAVVSDGFGMLVEQAAESFFIWRGVRPETAPVIAALRNR
ncbi:MAG: shikimate dehydrogenase [Nitrosomonadales bacterium]|nr:shikimate dehydrogenase [Nitrosomonadales bacterium]